MTNTQKAAPANTRQAKNAGGVNEKASFFSAGHDLDQQQEQPFFESQQVRRKMTVNEPGDHFEKQADQVADRVVKRVNQPKPAQPAVVAASATPAVQKKEEAKDEKKEQEQQKGDNDIQRRPIFESDADPNEGDTLKRKSNSAVPDVPVQTQQRIASRRGGGEPLPANIRRDMEGAMGADLTGVRIHRDAEAASLSNQLQAQAFTHGNDIYFGAGKYDTQSQSGQHLLAHELAHTLQQGGGIRKRESIQRVPAIQRTTPPAPAATPPPGPPYIVNNYEFDPTERTFKIPKISLPSFKQRNSGKFTWPLHSLEGRPPTNQVTNWQNAVRGAVNARVSAFLQNVQRTPQGTYFLKSRQSRFTVFGTTEQIQEESYIPRWNRLGAPNSHQVDHILEMQLGGADGVDNYELTDALANNTSGTGIQNERYARMRAGITELTTAAVPGVPAFNQLRSGYIIMFKEIDNWNLAFSGNGAVYWNKTEIEAGTHLQQLRGMTAQEVADAQGSAQELAIYVTEHAGTPRKIPIGFSGVVNNWIPGLDLTGMTNIPNAADGANFGTVTLQLNQAYSNSLRAGRSLTIPYNKTAGLLNTGNLVFSRALSAARNMLNFVGLSPIEIDMMELNDTKGMVIRGRIITDIPILQGANVDLLVEGQDISISKTFDLGEVRNFPAPFTVKDISVSVFASTQRGLGVEGKIMFEIQNLGTGELTGIGATGKGFGLRGKFDFDPNVFDSNITARYMNQQFSVEGEARIGAGKIRGLKSATINIGYAEGTLTASGSAEPDMKGIKEASINVTYGNDQLTIGGAFQLDENIPGIQSGNGNVQVTRTADGTYRVQASGTAVPKIPNINTSLSISYDDGAITVEGSASYTADRVSGNVTVGATNRAIGADGTPSGPAGDNFTAYGSGTLTLRVTEWLQASATVRVTPIGEIEVVGWLELPSAVDVFPRKSIHKNLFTAPTIQIPLFAIPLGPRSIGLVATINGGLDFEAGIGPGQLRNVFGEIQFNPSHPDQTRISGGAQFVIPANAGLQLHADLGIGLSIAAASVTGGIEIRGGLGLEGEASASVDLSWSPTAGFEFTATGEVEVHPKFTFDVNALLRASLDLGITSLSKEWRHNLASFSYGPDLQLRVTFPVHYKDGEAFDISTDDIQVTYPDINIPEIAGGLADQVKNAIL